MALLSALTRPLRWLGSRVQRDRLPDESAADGRGTVSDVDRFAATNPSQTKGTGFIGL